MPVLTQSKQHYPRHITGHTTSNEGVPNLNNIQRYLPDKNLRKEVEKVKHLGKEAYIFKNKNLFEKFRTKM